MKNCKKNKNRKYCAYKYRIYPTKEQASLIQQTFGCCRFVYNRMLSVQKERYENKQKHLSKFDAFHYMAAYLKPEYTWLRDVDNTVLRNSISALDMAYNRFFYKQGGFPKFKSRHKSKRSYTSSQSKNTIRIDGSYIRLPKLGKVKAKISRMPPEEWKLKSATVSQDAKGDYYCSLLYEYENHTPRQEINPDKVLGLDFKINGLYVSSENEQCDMPSFYKKSKDKLAKEQRKLSRKKGGKKGERKSKNYLKQLIKVNKIHVKMANQRKDFLHKKSNEIANHYDLVCIEDISVKDMMNGISKDLKLPNKAKHAINRAIMDNGWYSFTQMLSYKLDERGKMLVKAEKNFPSTQTCSICGNIQDMPLTKRIYHCECCHEKINRDYNASLNLRKEAMRIVFG